MCALMMQSSLKHAVKLSPWYAVDHEGISMRIAAKEDGFHEQVDVHTQVVLSQASPTYCVGHATQVSLFPGLHSATQCHAQFR